MRQEGREVQSAMPVLSATNISVSYGVDVILEEVSLSIEAGERIGIVGRNGEGKTTLLRVLGGMLKPDSGGMSLQKGVRAGYLHQDPKLDPSETLRGEAEAAFAKLHQLHKDLDAIFHEMEGAEGDALAKLMRRQETLEQEIEVAGGYVVDHKIDAVLHGLGFTDAQFSVPVRGLSGGQKARLALARLLLENPDVILLDEPTNHLDLDGRVWLENFLAEEFRGAVIMVSHDRYLLDRVVDRIIEVEHARLIDYPGAYSVFRELREERRLAQYRAFEKQQTKFKREEAFIRKYKAGQRAKQARGRESRLERAKMDEGLERPMEVGAMRLRLPKAERSGDLVLSGKGLCKAYDADDGSRKVLFDDLNVTISRGERWGIIGPNGAGKTTLVSCLLGTQETDAGTARVGSRVQTGYFRQSQEHIDLDLTVCRFLQQTILKENPEKPLSEQEARDLAGAFLFSGSDQDRPMRELSGGERSRAALAALLASAKNLLVLDEPTNHLDIPSAERLEEALAAPGEGDKSAFDGTLLLISHDRALIDATCDHLLVFDGKGSCKAFPGNYSDWRAHQDRRDDEAQSKYAPRAVATTPVTATATKTQAKDRPKSKFSWMQTDQLEAKIEELETAIARVDAKLADPEVWTDALVAAELNAKRDDLRAELDPIEEEWLWRLEG